MTFDDLLRAHDPAHDLPELTAARRTAILDRATSETPGNLDLDTEPNATGLTVRTKTARTGRAGTTKPARTGRAVTTRRRFLSGGWKTAVAVAAGSLVIAGAAQLGTTGAATAEASQVLFLAAGAATDPPARPDQWWEITSRSTVAHTFYANPTEDQGEGSRYLVETRRVTYLAVEGARPSWYDDKPVTVLQRLDGPEINPEPWSYQPWTTNLAPNEVPGSWQMPNPAWLAGLPRETEALRARLYADSDGHGSGKHDSAYTYAGDALRSGLVPADLRAALFRVIQTIPGTKITDAKAVVDGRTGVAIGRSNVFGVGYELVFDEHTGELIGERSKPTTVPGWDRLQFEASYSRTVVDAVPTQVQRDARRMKCTIDEWGSSCVPE